MIVQTSVYHNNNSLAKGSPLRQPPNNKHYWPGTRHSGVSDVCGDVFQKTYELLLPIAPKGPFLVVEGGGIVLWVEPQSREVNIYNVVHYLLTRSCGGD